MTVAELMLALEELDPTSVVVLAEHRPDGKPVASSAMRVARDDVYRSFAKLSGEIYHVVVVEY